MAGIQRALRSAVLVLSRAVSRFVVRPEADRLLRLLSEPILESSAYTSRALRDVEARLAPESDLAAMHAFRALHDLAPGQRVLLSGPAPVLLERALTAAGCLVTRANPAEVDAAGDFDAVVAFGAARPRGWGHLSRLDVEGVEIAVGRRR